jgi:peptidoglycan hydrolase-like protein with peptidoglycan-binding domain
MRKILITLVLLSAAACQHSSVTTTGIGTSAPAATTTSWTSTTTTTPAPTTVPATIPPTTVPRPPAPTAPEPATPAVLSPGDRGPEVRALQERLQALGYWLVAPDGSYGSSTAHAVTALQKAAGLARDGVAGPATQAALDNIGRVQPRSTGGHVVEVDLRRQLLVVADGGRATWVFDTSTGAVAGTTPTGHYRIQRQVDGYDPGPNGTLYRPKYFHEGVAVHGYTSVPPAPASHGCVRVTNAAMDFLWATGALPIGAEVWVY